MNTYQRFLGLLGTDPLLVGDVISHDPGDQSTVQLPGGALIRVRGQSVAISSKAFVRSGQVVGAAPNLTPLTIDV